ncbi:MAG: ion channel [Dermatophilaceae bacterium]
MTWLLSIAGAVLIGVALLDIFRTLWHPRGLGGVARAIFTVTWRLTRPLSRGSRSSELSGPLALVITVTVWTAMVVLGWALIYLPHLPEGFNYSSSLDPARSSGLVAAIYISFVFVATLGLGDIVPEASWLRLLVPLQALVGFVLLTAAISWILQLYPALGRRRALARRLSALACAQTREVVSSGEVSVAASLLDGVTEGVIQVQVDLLQYGESYFFREERAANSLAATSGVLLDLIDAGRAASSPEVRHAAEVLNTAVDDLSTAVATQYPHLDDNAADDPVAVMGAFARDHQHEPIRFADGP